MAGLQPLEGQPVHTFRLIAIAIAIQDAKFSAPTVAPLVSAPRSPVVIGFTLASVG